MEIKFLKDLLNNPKRLSIENKSISVREIDQLEILYNNGSPFPKVLRELLYLAGKLCYVLDYGIDETQEDLQKFVRENIEDFNKTIIRPFFVIDVYNANDQFLFVYLDEADDPGVYQAIYYDDEDNWISLVENKLSVYISSLVERAKEGRNPF